jgi:hypothetical protein
MIINREQDLYLWLKQRIPDLKSSEFQFSKWDCYSEELKCRIELKCRRKHYNTLLIEKKKYDAMISRCGEEEIPVYLNSTPKGIYGWNLKNINIKWEINNINPATTDFDRNHKVDKEVGYLNLKEAKQYEKF